MQTQSRPEPSGARAILADRIRKGGPVSVAEYMEVAAQHYYAGRDPFGVKGDFTTAPEISQMFGEMLGAWIIDAWMQMGKPERAMIVELGPGRGTLAADIMRTIAAWPDCAAAMSLHLVENSPLLRQSQAAALKQFNPTWYEKIDEVPEGLAFFVTNEFFDALPIRQFEKKAGRWQERCVGYDVDQDRFFFTLRPCDCSDLPPAWEGSVCERSPAAINVMEQIAARIDAQGGAALIIDYGYVKPGFGDTLQTVRRHKFSDVLENPGGDDITAHVDFPALKSAAEKRLRVLGPVEQGSFLTALGIMQRAESLRAKANDEQRREIDIALHRLVAPGEMGQLFKVMGLLKKDSSIHPAGFDEPQA